ncbi:hypothetical protein DFR52_104315 [Hoeflea marina]|uniref:Uncharacterized protein n=1 Tax=Hoeflea marina TaxID=274592 RepID=A0A317PG69_9HYPH|nr:hypothetical protein [Hoeflea marina]PWV99024.1 hypothetical protein DFR52_104315 [Hoeflea marina]
MNQVLIAIALILAPVSSALSATVINKDAQAQVLVVTEDGNTVNVAVDAGGQIEFCPNGCFVTMPSGDRETLSGSETIEIVNGSAVIR